MARVTVLKLGISFPSLALGIEARARDLPVAQGFYILRVVCERWSGIESAAARLRYDALRRR
jgi:hypothetical protein